MGCALLILAAGMGSRFGGLKQLAAVGPSGEAMLDYSIFDAIAARFDRLVFVIRRDFEQEFREKIVSRYADFIATEVVFQEIGDLPGGRTPPPGREKPWGTGHAIWTARNAIDQPFLAINADDFYGRNSYALMADFLRKPFRTAAIGMVAYPLRNTLSEHGAVSRGVCMLDSGSTLAAVEEFSGVERTEEGIRGFDSQARLRELSGDEMVSMNFWAFTPEIFPMLETLFCDFLDSGGLNAPKSEFYIPSAVCSLVGSGAVKAEVLSSTDRWLGVTYREDREPVSTVLASLVSNGRYPTPLWQKYS